MANNNALKPASSSEALIYAVKRLECTNYDGTISVGTCFAYKGTIYNGYEFTTLITNQHVVKDADELRVQFHARPSSDPTSRDLTAVYLRIKAEGNIFANPRDIDICAINIRSAITKWEESNLDKKIITAYIEDEIFLSDDYLEKLDTVEEVLMIGCPNGLWDEINGFPICRMGHTATHPSIDYKNKPEFLIDTAVFSGSSGSPVFLYDFNCGYKKSNDLAGKIKFGFLGVLWGGPKIFEDGHISSAPISTLASEIAAVSGALSQVLVYTRMHIGYVIKNREVVALINDYKTYVEGLQRNADTAAVHSAELQAALANREQGRPT